MILILTEVVAQTETFDRLVKKKTLEFSDIKDKIDPNNLTYKFKGSENKPNNVENYQILLKVFEDVRDDDVNPK